MTIEMPASDLYQLTPGKTGKNCYCLQSYSFTIWNYNDVRLSELIINLLNRSKEVLGSGSVDQ